MTVSPLADGLVADRYQLGEQVGQGGMGRVYRARDLILDRDVAVKLLDEGADPDTDAGRACAAEARAAARLSHPGIASVFDSGVHDGRLFVVMQLVSGRPLDRLISEDLRPVPLEAADIAAHVADALAYAHQQGVVHCDVKPQNIILTADGQPKLVDFGIARIASTTDSLAPEELRGSAPYVSPEQVRGESVDGRADVYALGAVLYELLTGRPPFQGSTITAILAQHLNGTAPPLRSLNPNVSVGLERVVLTALARNPSERYATAGAFRDALRGVVSSEQASAQASTQRVGQFKPWAANVRDSTVKRHSPTLVPWITRAAVIAIVLSLLLATTVLVLALVRSSARSGSATPQMTESTPSPVPTILPTLPSQPGGSSAPTAPALVPVAPSKPNGQSRPNSQSEQSREEQKKAEERAREDQKKQEEGAQEEQKKTEERERDKRGRGN